VFESLSERFEGIFSRISKRGRLSERDVEEMAGEIRRALIAADVNARVARTFVDRVKERAVGAEVHKALNPAQQIIKIVNDELVAILGGTTGKIVMSSKPPTIVMLAGLQGAGKTTHAAKLARYLKSQGLQPLLVGADLQRFAAVEQLQTLAERIDVPFFSEPSDPVTIARKALDEAARLGRNIVIVDTAGRLQIDEALMDELREMRDAIRPHNTLLVIDAMIGQQAVDVAEEFNNTIGLDGVIITKIDGDARGGAALSVKEVVGKPILFAGTGERLDEFEVFHPDRMASRILGMGDMLTLIEKAEEAFDTAQQERAEEIMREGTFTLEDFLEMFGQIKKMGPLQNVMGMLGGMPKELRGAEIDDREVARVEAIIHSMTPDERRKPEIITGSRRSRIAAGSGTTTAEVNNLLKQFKQMQQMMRQMGGMAKLAAKKGKKKKGGRVTAKGAGPPKGAPSLPPGFDLSKLGETGNLGDMGGPGGFPGMPPKR
jgi:signal recognition particle subunit SRP54